LQFVQGTEAYQRGDYQGAFDHFAASYRIAPRPAILFNMAQCKVQLGRPAEAIQLLEQLLARGTEPAIAEEARRTIERLRSAPAP
jgi:hypothetical protein